MLCPEIGRFKVLEPRLRVFSTSEPSEASLALPPFATDLRIGLPGHLHLPEELRLALSVDCEYYEVSNLPLDALVSEPFLKTFILQGQLSLFSSQKPARSAPNVFVSPDGVLSITLQKSAVPHLGLSAKPIMGKSSELALFQVQLKDLIQNERKRKEIELVLRDKIDVQGNIVFFWSPNDAGVCPSSIAKHLHNVRAKVSEFSPTIENHRVKNRPGEQADADAWEDWVGGVLLGAELEEFEASEKSLVVVVSGFFHQMQMVALIGTAKESLEEGKLSLTFSSKEYFPSKGLKKGQKNRTVMEKSRATFVIEAKNKEVQVAASQEFIV